MREVQINLAEENEKNLANYASKKEFLENNRVFDKAIINLKKEIKEIEKLREVETGKIHDIQIERL